MNRKTNGFGLMHEDQRGITLLELVIAIALAGIVTAGVTMMIFNVFGESTRTSNQRIALSQVQSAGYWIRYDALQARDVDTETDFLKLNWVDINGISHEVIYTLDGGGRLRRTYAIDSETQSDTVVAEHINPSGTYPQWDPDSRVLTTTVTATVGETDVSMTYEVKPRLG
jgi:prepilin-type N-terminal cleavage/methylation domain-containing protein